MSIVEKYINSIRKHYSIDDPGLMVSPNEIADLLASDKPENEAKLDKIFEKIIQIYEPFSDGEVNPGDIDKVVNAAVDEHSDEYLNMARENIAYNLELYPLYKALSNASELELMEYIRIKETAKMEKTAPFLAKLMKKTKENSIINS